MIKQSGCIRAIFIIGLLVLTGVLPTMPASAQSLEDVVIQGAAARRALTSTEISIVAAQNIARICLEYAEKNGETVAIAIINPVGDPVYSYRMDGMTSVNIETARWKAETSLYLRRPTSEIGEQYTLERQIAQMKMGLFINAGGIPIIMEDHLIGAIGVGGWFREDENCAYEGLESVLGIQRPSKD